MNQSRCRCLYVERGRHLPPDGRRLGPRRHPVHVDGIDLIVRKPRPFSRTEFDRREIVDFQGLKLAIATAEDIVVAKLEWAKLGASERQVTDVAGILRIRAGRLDLDYVRKWVNELDLQEQWDAASRAAGVTIQD